MSIFLRVLKCLIILLNLACWVHIITSCANDVSAIALGLFALFILDLLLFSVIWPLWRTVFPKRIPPPTSDTPIPLFTRRDGVVVTKQELDATWTTTVTTWSGVRALIIYPLLGTVLLSSSLSNPGGSAHFSSPMESAFYDLCLLVMINLIARSVWWRMKKAF